MILRLGRLGVLRAAAYRGDEVEWAPESRGLLNWGRFLVGGAGIWVDFYPRDLVVSLEWRPRRWLEGM